MIKPNITYVGFDDRRLFYIGVPVLAAILPLTFWGIDFKNFISNGAFEYVENLTYCLVFWVLCRQLVIELRKRYQTVSYTRKRLFIQAIIVIPLVPLVSYFIGLGYHFIYQYTGLFDACKPSGIQSALSVYFVVFTCFLLYDTIYFIQKYKEAVTEKNQLQLAHVQGQLDNLRNQINPHFLFNSLNTLMNLIPMDSERAMSYLDKLSRFYRYSVSNQQQTLTPLQSELEIAEVYVDLLHERFQHAIIVHLPKQVNGNAYILPLSLQLLIENAVKHNIVSHKKPLTITVALDTSEQYLWVRNNIQKKIQKVNSTGMGLKNIQERFAFFTGRAVKVEEAALQFSVGLPLIQSANHKHIALDEVSVLQMDMNRA